VDRPGGLHTQLYSLSDSRKRSVRSVHESSIKNKNMLVSDKRLNAVLTFHFPEIF
jgi:hypothetical protein